VRTDIHATEDARPAETLEVVAWRRSQLVAAGFDPVLADVLAARCSVDLHALIELVERGCPPELAARILAPLDGEPARC
jgi:hypothetical protein